MNHLWVGIKLHGATNLQEKQLEDNKIVVITRRLKNKRKFTSLSSRKNCISDYVCFSNFIFSKIQQIRPTNIMVTCSVAVHVTVLIM